ncbi:hypothetical protein ACROYT_G034071 [Oculina patagonica]
MLGARRYFSSVMVFGFATFWAFEGEGTMQPPTPNQAQVKRCDGITTTINVPFLEKHFTGDVMVTCTVLSKLQCEDLCIRNPLCKGFNYKNYQCEILSDIYSAYDREMSRGTRAFMKTFLLGKGECMN